MANSKLLLVQDVMSLGRSGDVVSVRPGYARNYLIPHGFGMPADKNTLRMQDRLKEERAKKAVKDKQESEALAKRLEDVTLSTEVKVDQDGHMYGSVSALDIVNLLRDKESINIDKHCVLLKHPIKATGVYTIDLKLPEGVKASVALKILSEDGVVPSVPTEETV